MRSDAIRRRRSEKMDALVHDNLAETGSEDSQSAFSATLIEESAACNNTIDSRCSIIDIKPEPLARLIGAQVMVVDAPAGLCDLVPLARELSERIVGETIKRSVDSGEEVPCRKGCAACCSYLVPLSTPEALCMGREIGPLAASPDPDNVQALIAAADRILTGWSKSPLFQTGPGAVCDIEAVGLWYASLKLPCPFLDHGTCSIYDRRPLACREHAVVGSASHCRQYDPTVGNRLEIPAKVLDALAQVAADLEQTEVQSVIMPLAPFWFEENRDRALRTWPGVELVSRFLECLSDTASQWAPDSKEIPINSFPENPLRQHSGNMVEGRAA